MCSFTMIASPTRTRTDAVGVPVRHLVAAKGLLVVAALFLKLWSDERRAAAIFMVGLFAGGWMISGWMAPTAASKGFARALFSATYAVTLVWSLWLENNFIETRGIPIAPGGDADSLYAAGLLIAEQFRTGVFSLDGVRPITGGSPNFGPHVLHGLLFLIRPDQFLVLTVNAFMAGLAAVGAFRLGVLLFREPIGRLAGILMASNPELIFWAGVTLKDSLFASLLVLGTAAAIEFAMKGGARALAAMCFMAAAMYITRRPLAFPWTALTLLFLVWRMFPLNTVRHVRIAIGTSVVFLLGVIVAREMLGQPLTPGWIVGQLRATQGGFTVAARSGSLISDASFSSLLDLGLTVPVTIGRAVVGALPWKLTGFVAFLGPPLLLRPIIWVPASFTIVQVLSAQRRRSELVYLALLAVGMLGAIAFGSFGEGPRRQLAFIAPMILLAAPALATSAKIRLFTLSMVVAEVLALGPGLLFQS